MLFSLLPVSLRSSACNHPQVGPFGGEHAELPRGPLLHPFLLTLHWHSSHPYLPPQPLPAVPRDAHWTTRLECQRQKLADLQRGGQQQCPAAQRVFSRLKELDEDCDGAGRVAHLQEDIPHFCLAPQARSLFFFVGSRRILRSPPPCGCVQVTSHGGGGELDGVEKELNTMEACVQSLLDTARGLASRERDLSEWQVFSRLSL